MRYYAFYSPEINVIVIQIIGDGLYITFEWDWQDMYDYLDYENRISIADYLWIPLGEL